MKRVARRTILAMSLLLLAANARAGDKLLEEVLAFNGAMLFLETRVPGMVIGAVRNGDTAVVGFGERADGSSKEPDGDTIMRIGSITKAFTGQVMASQVAGGTLRFTDRLQDRLGWPVTVPEKGGRPYIRAATRSRASAFTDR